MPNKDEILSGRTVADAYREAHAQLHSKPWHRGIPEEHAPLLNDLTDALGKQGFGSISEFFAASEQLNIEELDFKDGADFEARATKADREALKLKWK
jgi:hypothetical protein